MGGVGSGRKPLLPNHKVEEILALSSDILIKWLSNPGVDEERKIPVATQLVHKYIPAKLEGEGFGTTNYFRIIQNIPEGELRSLIETLRGRLSAAQSPLAVGEQVSPNQN